MRNLTASVISETESDKIYPIFLYEGVFVGFTLRLWSGYGNLSWDSKTWLGNGWLSGFQGVEESDDLGSTGMEVILMGVPQDLISTMLNSAQQNASGKMWLGFLNSSGSVIADPYLMFNGRLDVPTIDDKVDGPVIQISYESRLVDLDRPKEYRYTSESQKIFNPSDKGFEYVPQIAKGWKGQWGAVEKKVPTKKERNTTRKRGGGSRGGSRRR